MNAAPDPEKILGDAIDLIADSRDAEAEDMLNAFILTLKGSMNGSEADAERYYYWGRALALQEEWEQSLLRYESALQLKPNHEGALWETAVILMDELEKPESAKSVLEQRLLPLKPKDENYLEALASAEALIRRRDGRPLKAWKAGEVDAEAEAESDAADDASTGSEEGFEEGEGDRA
jgi:tetratricopeptide (TPR) repeat protein